MNFIMDFINPQMGNAKKPVIIDIKTTADASIEACRRSIQKQRLIVQASAYCDGVESLAKVEPFFVWAFVETKPPYHVTCLSPDFGSLEIGRKQYQGLIKNFKDCVRTNSWPGHDGGRVMPIGLSDWYMNEVEVTYSDEVFGD